MTKKRKISSTSYKIIKKPAKLGFLGYVGDTQGCGTIRVIYPYLLMNHIIEKELMVHASYIIKYIADPNFYKDFTIVQFQRSATKEHLQLFHHFKNQVQSQYKVPMVYEIDDLLINIPEWNYASMYYKQNEEYVKQMLSMANAITVTTEKLKEIYSEFNPKISVIPNHLPKFIWQDVFPAHEFKDESKKVKILYAGSQNHFPMPFMKEKGIHGGDFGAKLMEFIRKTTDKYEWIFMGAMPTELINLKRDRKITFHKWENIFNYPRRLKEIEPDICLASLQHNIFNSCKCLVGNTKIFTTKGIKDIKDIEKNDKVWQKNNFKNVSSVIKYKEKKTIKLITKCGYEIEGTKNHKIKSNGKFKKLNDFKLGDFCDLGFFQYSDVDYQELSAPLFLTKKLDSIDFSKLDENLLPKIKINEKWGRFIGYILGDGHLRTNNSIGISCNEDYPDVVDDIVNFAREIGLYNPTFVVKKVKNKKTDKYKNGKGIDVVLNSRNLKWFLSKKIGFKGVYKKVLRVPNVIWASPKSVVREFIRGLFEADGTVSNRGNCSFTTKDLRLAKEIQILLMGFGMKSKINSSLNKVYNKYYHTLILQRQACDIFYREINFISEKKKKRLKNIIIKKHSNAYKEWKMSDEVVEIIEGVNDVFDIQISYKKYYLANGIISHNSNIKSLEYAAIGAPGVYSDIDPYSNMTLKTNNDEEFISHIEKLADNIDFRAEVWNKDYKTVEDQLWWEENGNVKKYINTYLNFFGNRL